MSSTSYWTYLKYGFANAYEYTAQCIVRTLCSSVVVGVVAIAAKWVLA